MSTIDAPQADRLDLVRRVVEAAAEGQSETACLAATTGMSLRYAQYCIHAARLLALVELGSPSVTELGRRLLATQVGSHDERQVLRDAVGASMRLAPYASILFGDDAPSTSDISAALQRDLNASASTAARRARTLLSWRRYFRAQAQLTMEFDSEWPDEDLDVAEATEDVTSESRRVPSDPSEVIDGFQPSSAEDNVEGSGIGVTAASTLNDVLPDIIEAPVERSSPSGSGDGYIDERATSVPVSAASNLLSSGDLAYLRRHIELGTAVFFSGAGFSLGAFDRKFRSLPSGPQFARELWSLCYPSEDYDGSSLQDVFETAQRRQPRALEDLLKARFDVDSASLPDWYELWFSMPWLRAYTLNVDNLASAAQRRFSFARTIYPVSALSHQGPLIQAGGLATVHLNGIATDGSKGVTFSHTQYAERLARQEPSYAQLAAELMTHPFVFVGSPLEEPLLWEHIVLRGQRVSDSASELRAKSFLVTPELNRGRADKLRSFNAVWVKATGESFARVVLSQLTDSAEKGRNRISATSANEAGGDASIVEISSTLLGAPRRGAYLLGDEPTWSDIREGRAVERDEDAAPLQAWKAAVLKPKPPQDKVPVFAVTATAGAGKTTLLMKGVIALHASGARVALVGSTADVSPHSLVRHYRRPGRPPVLMIDDAGRYGSELVPTLIDLSKSDELRAVVLSLRSHHTHLLENPSAAELEVHRHAIGPLTDDDINRLLDVLTREHRLGALLGLMATQQRQALRERADRQILVAMIEATSGQRFEDKIVSEWSGLDAISQYIYALSALATSYNYAMSKDEILLSCNGKLPELESIRKLASAHLLQTDESGRLRVRHRVIAEKLIEELTGRGTHIERLVVGLGKALAIKVEAARTRSSKEKRVLKRLLQHNALLRLLRDEGAAGQVYGELEQHLHWDYHFWLQRGCLELEAGQLRQAENFIQQASALNNTDPLVETAHAHMILRRAISNPSAMNARDAAEKAFETLRKLIAARSNDHYPAHVFGSQALSWCRHAGLTPRDRTTLIREARDFVQQALALHRSRQELKQLLTDLRRAELESGTRT